MGDSLGSTAAPELLHYRGWQGEPRGPLAAVWPIARTALGMVFRRRLFWVLYALALLMFALFFFGQYLMAWAQTQVGEEEVQVGGMGRANPRSLIRFFQGMIKLDGSGETYRNFFRFQAAMTVILLALAGALLIGNDLRFGSLPFYLSKPLARWHYLLGKGLAIAVLVNMLTTGPAVVLYVQYGVLESWDYFTKHFVLLLGILAYGLLLTVVLTLLLLATATWLRRTAPLIMAWATLFFFLRLLSGALVVGLHFHPRWRLMDLWNDLALVGNICLGIEQRSGGTQPAWSEAALILGGVSLSCLTYLVLRIRAVEIVR